jgi:hypothetical protein
MPHKNPERKRQWEREHREQRNALLDQPVLCPCFAGEGDVGSELRKF